MLKKDLEKRVQELESELLLKEKKWNETTCERRKWFHEQLDNMRDYIVWKAYDYANANAWPLLPYYCDILRETPLIEKGILTFSQQKLWDAYWAKFSLLKAQKEVDKAEQKSWDSFWAENGIK